MAAAKRKPTTTGPDVDDFTGIPKRPDPPVTRTAPPAPQPIIEIKTVLEREFVTIDDERYDLASWHDFGIVERQQLQQMSVEFNRLWATEDLNSRQRKRLEQLLDLLFAKAIPGLPADVAGRLDDANREALVMAFTLAPIREINRSAQETQEQDQARTGPSITAS